MTDTVLFEEKVCQDGHKIIGIATLSNLASLNALTYRMLDLLNQQLLAWQAREEVVAVIIDGDGEKAFCAGGDVRAMYHVMAEGDDKATMAFCTRFFTLEYECDYLIHTFGKPIIGWGDGIVMGGGIGLFSGCSHKVVTPSSRLAMPEVFIGLYPDVGATWFLNQMEDGLGLFMGLTGVTVNAADALDTKMADYLVRSDDKSDVIHRLVNEDWEGRDPKKTVSNLLHTLSDKAEPFSPEPQLAPIWSEIKSACSEGSLSDVVTNILSLEGDEKWLEKAKHGIREGSAVSAHITYRQIRECRHLSLADCFRLELTLSVRSSVLGEFREGVRSRLIDKDGDPKWLFRSVTEVDEAAIDLLFTSLWSSSDHPLAALGK